MTLAPQHGVADPDRPGFARRVRSAIFYATFLACFPTVTAVYFHARYARAQQAGADAASPFKAGPGVDARVEKLLGYAITGRQGSFSRHPLEKPAGRVRIGCFGDSFTFGDEVDEGQDFPSLLEAQLHAAGWTQVEVLNFGMPWHGFHQSYMVWEQVGRRYDLDYVLLGPASFQVDRDNTFNHSGTTYPGYLHARYVLEGDGIRLIEVAGDSLDERLHLYNRLVPLLSYMRYDRHPPAFLRALVPEGSELPNPFYYRRGPARVEALEIARRLIHTMGVTDNDRQVVLGNLDPEIAAMGTSVALANVTAYPIVVPPAFPYVAARGHFSSVGNALVAAHYLQALTGRVVPLPLFRTTDVVRPQMSVRGDLSTYAEISVRLGDVALGGFTEANRAAWIDPRLFARLGAPFLVGIQPASGSALDACYIPTDTPLEPGLPLTLRRGSTTVPLGDVRLLTAGATIGTVTVTADRVPCSEENGLEIALPAAQRVEKGDVEVSLGGRVLLRGSSDGSKLRLKPDPMQLIMVRAIGTPLLEASLPSSDTVWLTARSRSGERSRVALAHWVKGEEPSSSSPLGHPLLKPLAR